MLSQIVIPEATPARRVKGYKMPERGENLVSWDFVSGQMSQARYYWISTVFPDANQVVLIEGTAHMIQDDEIDDETWKMLDSTFQRKYQLAKGSPYLYVQLRRVLAWDGEDLTTMTRWVFERKK